MEWSSTLAVLATVTSFTCQLVGIEICWRIVQRGGTGDMSVVPFIAFFVSACTWLKYGIMMSNTSVMLTSGLGSILQFLYICIYYVYSTNKRFLHPILFIGFISLFAPLVYVTYFENEADRAMRNMGLYCCVISVAVYASPLATLSDVIKHKSTDSISKPLCVVNFMCSIEWSLYAIVIKDYYLLVPNAIGGIFGIIQFYLFCHYGCKRTPHHRTILVTGL